MCLPLFPVVQKKILHIHMGTHTQTHTQRKRQQANAAKCEVNLGEGYMGIFYMYAMFAAFL